MGGFRVQGFRGMDISWCAGFRVLRKALVYLC